MGTGYWILGTGYWILDTGYGILDTGNWVIGNDEMRGEAVGDGWVRHIKRYIRGVENPSPAARTGGRVYPDRADKRQAGSLSRRKSCSALGTCWNDGTMERWNAGTCSYDHCSRVGPLVGLLLSFPRYSPYFTTHSYLD